MLRNPLQLLLLCLIPHALWLAYLQKVLVFFDPHAYLVKVILQQTRIQLLYKLEEGYPSIALISDLYFIPFAFFICENVFNEGGFIPFFFYFVRDFLLLLSFPALALCVQLMGFLWAFLGVAVEESEDASYHSFHALHLIFYILNVLNPKCL